MGNRIKISLKWTADTTGAIVLGLLAAIVAGGFRWAAASNVQDAIYYTREAAIDDRLGLGVYKNLDENYAAQALIDAHYQSIVVWIFVAVTVALVMVAGYTALHVTSNRPSADVP